MKENSEEDIKNIEEIIELSKEEIDAKDENMTAILDIEDLISLEHILSDYKRVLKEANRYKNMYKAEHEIHLVRNEQLDRKENAITRCKELETENKSLKEYIAKAPNLDEMTATKYRNIQQDAYIQGRAEEQQKAEQIIYENYIPVQKIKDKIEELKGKLEDISKRREKSKTKEEGTVLWCLEIRTDERIKTLQELL